MNKERGSVVIIVSFCIVLFITILAFIVNVGYLSATKNIYENAAEAAAMAGVARLCDGDAIEVAKQIAKENGAPQGSVTVTLGFYDEENEKFYPEGSIPEGEYKNAVKVSIQSTENTILGGFLGKEQTQVRGVAVAYLVMYGMLAGDGIVVGENSWGHRFYSGQPEFKNGDIHANGDINFRNNAPGIDEDTVRVTAHGTVTGYDLGISNADIVKLPPIDEHLDRLREKATKILSESDFPFTNDPTDLELGEDGNYYGYKGSTYYFAPHPGDHGGAIYYFEFSDENSKLALANNFGNDARVTNLIIATNRSVYRRRVSWDTKHQLWGGDGHTVLIVAKGDINFGNPGYIYTDSFWDFEGTIFWAGNNIYYRVGGGAHNVTPQGEQRILVRMIAGKNISVTKNFIPWPSVQFDFKFGPPCPPCIIKLGRLR